MSQWASLSAQFRGDYLRPSDITSPTGGVPMPRGSEGPLDVEIRGVEHAESADEWHGAVFVRGRLRDFIEMPDAYVALAWFATACVASNAIIAHMDLRFDGGAAYRLAYDYAERRVRRVRGVLDL